MKRRTKLLIGILVAVLALTIVPAATFAQEGPKPPTHPGGNLFKPLLDAAAQALNMTPQDFMQALRDGQTPAQLAEEAGVSTEDLTAAMQTAWNAQGERLIPQFIENGPSHFRKPISRFSRRGFSGRTGRIGRMGMRLEIKTAADTLDMSVPDFMQALRDGQTPAEIAEKHGSSGQALADAIVAAQTEKLEQAVANGRLSQERADEILARMNEVVTHWVENGLPGPRLHR